MSTALSPNTALQLTTVNVPISVFEVTAPFRRTMSKLSLTNPQGQLGNLGELFTHCAETFSIMGIEGGDIKCLVLPLEPDHDVLGMLSADEWNPAHQLYGTDALYIGEVKLPRISSSAPFRGFHRDSGDCELWSPEGRFAASTKIIGVEETGWVIAGTLYTVVTGFNLGRGSWSLARLKWSYKAIPYSISWKQQLLNRLLAHDTNFRRGALKNLSIKSIMEAIAKLAGTEDVDFVAGIEYPLTTSRFTEVCSALDLGQEDLEVALQAWQSHEAGGYNHDIVSALPFLPSFQATFTGHIDAKDPRKATWRLINEKTFVSSRKQTPPFNLPSFCQPVNVTRLKVLIDRLRYICVALHGHGHVWAAFADAARDFKTQLES